MKKGAAEGDIQHVIDFIHQFGLKTHLSKGRERTIIGVIGEKSKLEKDQISVLRGVSKVYNILQPFKLVSREFQSENSVIQVNDVAIGGGTPVIFAGPCSVENERQILDTAWMVKEFGAKILRGGAFKPRTSPYSFQGLGLEGLKLLKKAREETGLSIVTEVMDPADVELISEYADILQVGSRSMQNFNLLKAVGRTRKPVLLKRGMSATLTELLMSAEYIMSEGNPNIILCERGIRTFVEYSRNTLDLNIVPAVQKISHLPIIVDPSHGTGRSDLVAPLSLAAIAVGADGLMVEVHPKPELALSDANQSLNAEQFGELMRKVIQLIGWRKMHAESHVTV